VIKYWNYVQDESKLPNASFIFTPTTPGTPCYVPNTIAKSNGCNTSDHDSPMQGQQPTSCSDINCRQDDNAIPHHYPLPDAENTITSKATIIYSQNNDDHALMMMHWLSITNHPKTSTNAAP